MKRGCLYIVWNDINEKLYVGITTRKPHRRFHEHIYAAENYKDKYQFHAAIRKHGAENFHMDILLSDIPFDRLLLFEAACVKHFDTYKHGYNSDPGGGGLGKEVGEEARAKMSKIHKGKIPWNKGIPMPDYIREKLLATHLGHKASEETRKKMSEHRKGHPGYMLGKHHSPETCKRISESHLKRNQKLREAI